MEWGVKNKSKNIDDINFSKIWIIENSWLFIFHRPFIQFLWKKKLLMVIFVYLLLTLYF